jgi:hypothetical protein
MAWFGSTMRFCGSFGLVGWRESASHSNGDAWMPAWGMLALTQKKNNGVDRGYVMAALVTGLRMRSLRMGCGYGWMCGVS